MNAKFHWHYISVWSIEVYKVYINDDPWLTLTNLTAMSNLALFASCAFSRPS